MPSDPQVIMDALRRIVQALRQSSAHCEKSSGITGAQALVLKHVAAGEGLSVNEPSRKSSAASKLQDWCCGGGRPETEGAVNCV
jgi:hypothetical protein